MPGPRLPLPTCALTAVGLTEPDPHDSCRLRERGGEFAGRLVLGRPAPGPGGQGSLREEGPLRWTSSRRSPWVFVR